MGTIFIALIRKSTLLTDFPAFMMWGLFGVVITWYHLVWKLELKITPIRYKFVKRNGTFSLNYSNLRTSEPEKSKHIDIDGPSGS